MPSKKQRGQNAETQHTEEATANDNTRITKIIFVKSTASNKRSVNGAEHISPNEEDELAPDRPSKRQDRSNVRDHTHESVSSAPDSISYSITISTTIEKKVIDTQVETRQGWTFQRAIKSSDSAILDYMTKQNSEKYVSPNPYFMTTIKADGMSCEHTFDVYLDKGANVLDKKIASLQREGRTGISVNMNRFCYLLETDLELGGTVDVGDGVDVGVPVNKTIMKMYLKHRCFSACNNFMNVCLPTESWGHLKFGIKDLVVWADAVSRGEATLSSPPIKLVSQVVVNNQKDEQKVFRDGLDLDRYLSWLVKNGHISYDHKITAENGLRGQGYGFEYLRLITDDEWSDMGVLRGTILKITRKMAVWPDRIEYAKDSNDNR